MAGEYLENSCVFLAFTFFFFSFLWLPQLHFYKAKTVSAYLPLSPEVQEAQEALVHPT